MKKKGFVISFFKHVLNDKINKIKLDLISKILMKIGIYKILIIIVVAIS